MDTEITVCDLLNKLDQGDPVLLLDVRNADEFASWRFEGKRPAKTVNIPYFEFIEEPETALSHVPRVPTEIAVICAKGGSSEFVADLLRESGIPARNVAGGMRAYGSYLEPVRITTESAACPEIWQMNRRGKGCLSYIVRSTSEAIIVDPSRHVQSYLDFVCRFEARVVRVLDTHVHADHLSGGPELAQRLGVPYFATAGDAASLSHQVTPLADGTMLPLGKREGVIRVLATPGHTPGSTCYVVAGRYLLSGDTLFVNGIGRPDLGGEVEAWSHDLFKTLTERLAELPDELIVLPGHYASSAEIDAEGIVSARLGDLRAHAPEFRLGNEPAFVSAMLKAVQTPPAAYAGIVRVNLGLAQTEDEQATEWELGKNECAAARHG